MTFEVMSPRSHRDLSANNLRPREKRLIIVFPTVDTAEQGVGRAERIEAIGDDYANGAEVMRSPNGLIFLYVLLYKSFRVFQKFHIRFGNKGKVAKIQEVTRIEIQYLANATKLI